MNTIKYSYCYFSLSLYWSGLFVFYSKCFFFHFMGISYWITNGFLNDFIDLGFSIYYLVLCELDIALNHACLFPELYLSFCVRSLRFFRVGRFYFALALGFDSCMWLQMDALCFCVPVSGWWWNSFFCCSSPASFIYLFLYLVECLLNFISLDIVRGFFICLVACGAFCLSFFIVGTIYLFNYFS